MSLFDNDDPRIPKAQPKRGLETGDLRPKKDLSQFAGAPFIQGGAVPSFRRMATATPNEEELPTFIPFEVSGPADGKVTVQRGWVLCIDPKSTADPMMNLRIPPELDVDPAAEFSVSAGQSLAIKVDVDEKDIITAVSAVVVSTTIASTHPQPPPSAAGEGAPPPLVGFYYYRIADFITEGGNLVTRQIHSGAMIVHRPLLPEMYNVENDDGARYEIFKKWNAVEARYEWRAIVQMEGTDVVPIIMPLQDGEPPYDAIKWRGLKGKDTLAQIRVRTVGGVTDTAITIEGNGVDGTAGINLDGTIEVEDGLVKTLTEGTRGDDFNLVNYPCLEVGPLYPDWTIYFRKGLAFLTDPDEAEVPTRVMYNGFSCIGPDGP